MCFGKSRAILEKKLFLARKQALIKRLRFTPEEWARIMRACVDYYQDELDYMYCLAMRGAPEHVLGSDAAIRAKFDRPSASGRQPENLCTCRKDLCCFCYQDDLDDDFRENQKWYLLKMRWLFEGRTRAYFAKLEAEEAAGREERRRTLQFRLGVALAVVCSALAVVVP